MFDEFKRTRRAQAATNPRRFALQAALSMAVLGVLLFENVAAGLVGGVATWFGAWYWWRPGGPGETRVRHEEDRLQ